MASSFFCQSMDVSAHKGVGLLMRQPLKILRKLLHSLFTCGPGGDEADGGVVLIHCLLVLELVAFPESGDQVIGQDGELLVGGGIREVGEAAVR